MVYFQLIVLAILSIGSLAAAYRCYGDSYWGWFLFASMVFAYGMIKL